MIIYRIGRRRGKKRKIEVLEKYKTKKKEDEIMTRMIILLKRS